MALDVYFRDDIANSIVSVYSIVLETNDLDRFTAFVFLRAIALQYGVWSQVTERVPQLDDVMMIGDRHNDDFV